MADAVKEPPIKAPAVPVKYPPGKPVVVYCTKPGLGFNIEIEDVEYIRDSHGTTKTRVLKPPYLMKFMNGKTTIPFEVMEKITETSPPGTPDGVQPKKGDFWYGFLFMTAQDLAERFKRKEQKGFVKEMWRCWGIGGVHNTDTVSEFEFTEKIREELSALKLL